MLLVQKPGGTIPRSARSRIWSLPNCAFSHSWISGGGSTQLWDHGNWEDDDASCPRRPGTDKGTLGDIESMTHRIHDAGSRGQARTPPPLYARLCDDHGVCFPLPSCSEHLSSTVLCLAFSLVKSPPTFGAFVSKGICILDDHGSAHDPVEHGTYGTARTLLIPELASRLYTRTRT